MSSPVVISLPRSKSIVIRCLIVNYLKNRTLLPVCNNDANDVIIVHNALREINLSLKKIPQSSNKPIVIDVEDCGAAYRFLMALLAVTKGKWLLTGTTRLLQRPILPLVHFLNSKGASIEKTESGWLIEGKELNINSIEIDTSETSQFASAVMMVVGSKNQSSRFNSYGLTVLQSYDLQNPYIEMTQTILNNFEKQPEMVILADWSAAIFWFANALLVPNAHYFLENLHFDGLQGDAKIASWFQKWGVCITEKEKGIEVKHCHKIEIPKQHIDVKHTPDLAQILAVLSVCYPFQLTLSGLKNINLKESNRLDITVKELSKFTKIDKFSEDVIIINKRTEKLPSIFQFDSYNDHRFVMAWALFKNFGTVKIQNVDCVKKSYPGFEKIFN